MEEPSGVKKPEARARPEARGRFNRAEPWQQCVNFNMALLQECDRYEDLLKAMQSPCSELGTRVPEMVMTGEDWVLGEDDFLDMYSDDTMNHITLGAKLRHDEQEEERLINIVIKEEVAANFTNHAGWAFHFPN